MAINMAYLELRLSGGASETDPNNSLGDVMSSERVLSQSATGLTMGGITIDYSCGNALGAGTFAFTNSTTTLSWTPSGGTIGSAIDVSTDGRYVISDSTTDQQLHITVTAASLPSADDSDSITIAGIDVEVFDDTTKQQAVDGRIDHRCLYITNTHPTDSALNVTIWRESDASGADSLRIGADPVGVGDGSTTGVATTIATETDVPSGVTFSAPTTSGTGINLGTLAAGEAVAYWEERDVPAVTTVTTDPDMSQIGIAAYL